MDHLQEEFKKEHNQGLQTVKIMGEEIEWHPKWSSFLKRIIEKQSKENKELKTSVRDLSSKIGLTDHRMSIWFMRDNHTFIEIKSRNKEKLLQEVKKVAEENHYGLLGNGHVIDKYDKENRRVGLTLHVDGNGEYKGDLDEWYESMTLDSFIKKQLQGS